MINFILGIIFTLVIIYRRELFNYIKNRINKKKPAKISKISIEDGWIVFTYDNGNEYQIVEAGEDYSKYSSLNEDQLKRKLDL